VMVANVSQRATFRQGAWKRGQYRKFHDHRFLSGDVGNPHLEKVVAVVTALMRVSPDRETFMRHFNRNFRPHLPEQMDLFLEVQAREKSEAAN
jgi:hypothetical protein